MKKLESILLLTVVILLVQFSQCSHFRGAIISWKPSGRYEKEILITYRVSWRRSQGSAYHCSDIDIKSKIIHTGQGHLLISHTSGNSIIASATFVCTDFNVAEDWSTGEKLNIPYNVTDPYFRLGFSGANWIALQVGGNGRWEVWTMGNITKRSNGKINSSPVTSTAPIIRVQKNCFHAIELRVSDADDDFIKCRFAKGYPECGTICNGIPGAVLDERTCVLFYNATGRPGMYGVAIQIEDYANLLDTKPLSSVGLQFLFNVYSSKKNCSSRPRFSQITRKDSSCIGVPVNETFKERIYATTGTAEEINSFSTSSPQGLSKSDVKIVLPNETIPLLEPLPAIASWYYIEITWTPTKGQSGGAIFCFIAVAKSQTTTKQRCITFIVGASPPSIIKKTPQPNALIVPRRNTWEIVFNRKFVRPTRSTFFRIYNINNRMIYNLDISSSRNYEILSGNKVTVKTPGLVLEEKKQYFVALDHGFVKGLSHCGSESKAIFDTQSWNITIKDVTPPVLTFTKNEQVTNTNITISWSYNEVATSRCVLNTPTTVFSVNCSALTWTDQIYVEGVYTLFVYGTDESGNTGLAGRHTWSVDTTPPKITILKKPSSPSNKKQVTITFYCPNEVGCTARCKLLQQNNIVIKSFDCRFGRFVINDRSTLKSGKTYTLEIIATDMVGNKANPWTWSWKTDFEPPTIAGVFNHTVSCGNSLSPNVIGIANATDALDNNPVVTYSDTDDVGCVLVRTWTATDSAMNQAQTKQYIHLVTVTSIKVKMKPTMLQPCNENLKKTIPIDELIAKELVEHPCNRAMTATYVDTPLLLSCDSITTRTWTFSDNCGQSTTFQQIVKVLPIQEPIYPKIRQLNVGLRDTLKWPTYPNSDESRLFIWLFSLSKNKSVTIRGNSYTPNKMNAFLPDTKMVWQVEYVLNENYLVNNLSIVPSPVWGFTTVKVPDFSVISISEPVEFFTGRTVQVSWTVRNVGTGSNFAPSWYDTVFFSKSKNANQGLLATVVRRRGFLFHNDAYVNKAIIKIPNDMPIGKYYIIVFCDIHNRINDYDRGNNRRISKQTVMIKLTPPPDLRVDEVVIPTKSFSGLSIDVHYIVKNHGYGVTATSNWIDRIYWSRNFTSDRFPLAIGSSRHSGQLFPLDIYKSIVTVKVPKYIYGIFFVGIRVDEGNAVFEHVNKRNNFLISEQIQVILTPPPDLIVSKIWLPSQVRSKDRLKVSYKVENIGSGDSDKAWWYDRISIHPASLPSVLMMTTPAHTGLLDVATSYSKDVYFIIPDVWDTGNYTVTVTTDLYSNVFESGKLENNAKMDNLQIIQSLPDLFIQQFNVQLLGQHELGNILLMLHVGIKNIGARDVSDDFSYSVTMEFDDKSKQIIDIQTISSVVEINKTHFYYSNITIQRQKLFSARFILQVDIYGNIYEGNENNNGKATGYFNLPVMFDDIDFSITHFINPENGQNTTDVFSGDEVDVRIKYINKNIYPSTSRFTDQVTLKIRAVEYLLKETEVSMIMGGETKTMDLRINIPKDLFGQGQVFLKHDIHHSLIKATKIPLEINKTIMIEFPPTPELVMETVSVRSIDKETNSFRVFWHVRNTGNHMKRTMSWTDSVVLSRSEFNPYFDGWFLLDQFLFSGKLQTDQSYTQSKAVIIPIKSTGFHYIHVIEDSENILKSNSKDRKNYGWAKVQIPIPSYPDLEVIIESVVPHNLRGGERFTLQYAVLNTGPAAQISSWIDQVLIKKMDHKGFTVLSAMPHIGGLDRNSNYSKQIQIVLPAYFTDGLYELKVKTDGNNKLVEVNETNNEALFVYLNTSTALPVDIEVVTQEKNISAVAGQPLKITYNVSNKGPGSVPSLFPWFDALYLSEDAQLDVFDLKMCVKKQQIHLPVNASYHGTFDCNLPFFLPGDFYYLLLKADDGNLIREIKEYNNIGIVLLKNIGATITSDVTVLGVNSQASIQYGQSLKTSWKLVNNGTTAVEGYKCDSVYLSTNIKWDITDAELGTTCSFLSLEGKVSSSNEKLFSFTKPVPLIRQDSYYSIVKTRSNIIDHNLLNNDAFSKTTTFVSHHNLTLGVESTFLLRSDSLVFRVPNVPSGESLIVVTRGTDPLHTIELYVKFKNPPNTDLFDVFSGEFLSSVQKAVIKNTKKGDYYVLIRTTSVHVVAKQITVLSKLAKPEITDVYPKYSPPLYPGTTFKIEGALFPLDFSIRFFKKSQPSVGVVPMRSYRYSSTLIYATVNISVFYYGDTVNIEIKDDILNKKIVLVDAVNVVHGQSGTVTTRVNSPRAVRRGEIAELSIDTQNIGGTDAMPPIIMINLQGNVNLRLVQSNKTIHSDTLLLFAAPQDGPAGVLPPGSVSRIDLTMSQTSDTIGSLPVLVSHIILKASEKHPYVNGKDLFRPMMLEDRRWNPVWKLFLKRFGTNMYTFYRRLSLTFNQLSLVGLKVYDVNEVIKYELELANGFHIGQKMHHAIDLQASGDNFPFVSLERYINPQLSFRDIPGPFNGFGPFGRGWISPLWSMKLRNITVSYIILEKEYDYFSFVNDKIDSTFINPDGLGEIYYNQTSGQYIFHKMDSWPPVTYIFYKESDYKVTEVRSHDNSTIITVDHAKDEVYDNYGNKIKVHYGDKGFVSRTKLMKNDQLVNSITYLYNDGNFLIQITKDEKFVTNYEYDSTHKALAKVINPDKSYTQYFYDADGLYKGLSRYSEDSVLLKSAELVTTAPGELEMVEQPENHHSTLRYDLQGKLAYIKRKGSPSYHFMRQKNEDKILLDDVVLANEKYDLNSKIKTVTNAEGATTKIHLADDNIAIKELHDAKNNVYKASYLNDKLVRSIYPDGKYESYTYDQNNFLTETAKRSGKKISYVRDKDGFMFEKHVSNGLKTTFSYNNDGQLSKASTSISTVEIKYDTKKRPVSVTYDNKRTLYYTYDSYGRRSSLTDSTGQYNVTYKYDVLGRIANVKKAENLILNMKYSNRNVLSRETGNGDKVEYSFNTKTNKIQKILLRAEKNKTVDETFYEYDRFGRIRNITTSKEKWEFRYDAISQLTLVKDKNGLATEFEYDATLNRRSKYSGNKKVEYVLNNMNQIAQVNEDEYVYYDIDGNINRVQNLKTKLEQRFEYNGNDKLVSSINGLQACSYDYDALGNLKKQTCGDEIVEYLIDPFGLFGTDVIGKYSGENTTLFYYGMEQGLICKHNVHENDTYYYHFDHLGSTIYMSNQKGETINSYSYDPFGNVISKNELVSNEFLFVGQWGVRKIPGFTEIYDMRNRIYHAGYGRFMNLDPYGFSGKSTNMYCYMANNPVAGNDPRGTIVPAIIGGAAIIGAVVNTEWYIASNINSFGTMKAGDIVAGAVGAAVSGAALGAGTALVSTLLPVTGVASFTAMVGVGAGSAGLGNVVEQLLDTKKGIDVGSLLEASVISGITGNIPFKLKGYLGKGFSAFGNAKNGLIRNIKLESILKAVNAHGKTLWKTLTHAVVAGGVIEKVYKNAKNIYDTIKGLPEKSKKAWNDFRKIVREVSKQAWKNAEEFYENGKNLVKNIKDFIDNKLNDLKEAGKKLHDYLEENLNKAKDKLNDLLDQAKKNIKDWVDQLKKMGKGLWEGLLEWIESLDPNDILGPAGFGDARFISPDTTLKYKIRFENHVNATAPAQKVSISSVLDKDLDFRTFRIGSLGFGNFTFKPERSSSILQTKFDLISSLAFYIRVVAGIDVVTGEITFEIEALDPETGQRPANPRIGFLPPNPVNGTEGQGFVTYSIRPRKEVPNLSVIDAKASIVFDQNEPISTPPIFNTIDSSTPTVNISSFNNNASSIIISLDKFDNGSGVKYVDVYNNNGVGVVEPLAEGVTTQLVALPLKVGHAYDILAVAVDNVGNKASINDALVLNIVVPDVTCNGVNNCSGYGNCTGQDLCSCFEGRYGSSCNSNVKPLEPPITSSSDTQIRRINDSFPLNVYIKKSDRSPLTTLTVFIHDIPENVKLSNGKRNGTFVVLEENELLNLSLIVSDAVPSFTLRIVAEQRNQAGHAKSRTMFAKIIMGLTSPDMFLQSTCFKAGQNSVTLNITVQVASNDTTLMVHITQLPKSISIANISTNQTRPWLIPGFPGTVSVVLISKNKFLDPFTVTIRAKSSKANQTEHVEIETKSVIKQCSSVLTTTTTTTTVISPTKPEKPDDDNRKTPVVIGGVIGLVILLVVIVIIVKVRRARKNNRSSNTEMVTLGGSNEAYRDE